MFAMLRTATLALLLTGLATAASAQSIGEPLPRKSAPYEATAKPAAKPGSAARPCPEYGAGFIRMAGSAFCVRAGGAVRAEFGKSSRNGYGLSLIHIFRDGFGENFRSPVDGIQRFREG